MNLPRIAIAASSARKGLTSMSVTPVRHASQMPDLPFGKRQIEQAKNWIPSLGLYGAVGGTLLVYLTDWRVITDFIPFYNGKYKDE